MIVKLLTEHHLESLSLKGGCTGSSESTHVKMSNCWKCHALAHFIQVFLMIDVLNNVVALNVFESFKQTLYKKSRVLDFSRVEEEN